jgi:hypothetical protein
MLGRRNDPKIPETIDNKKWNRFRDNLPFPAEPNGKEVSDLVRRIKFNHQRNRRELS